MQICSAPSTRTTALGFLLSLCSALSTQISVAQSVDLGDFTSPATLSYQNSFSNPQAQFTDWYAFSVNDSSYNGITASISFTQMFGFSQLNTELYEGHLNNNQVILGSLKAQGNTSQTTFGNALQITSIIAPSALSAGEYLIKISGSVIGTFGGTYAGVANMAPVPLPPTLPLVAMGVGLIGLIRWKRSRP